RGTGARVPEGERSGALRQRERRGSARRAAGVLRAGGHPAGARIGPRLRRRASPGGGAARSAAAGRLLGTRRQGPRDPGGGAAGRPACRLEERLRAASMRGRTALLPYLVAGYPEAQRFDQLLLAVAARADVVELGLPFSDPTADGPVIAAAAREA